MKGDCPAFATVTTAPGRPDERPLPRPPDDLPDPATPIVPTDRVIVRLTGIGGTGVITISQILGTAAMLGGLRVRGLDQTGLSQKAGPVVSDLRITSADTPTSNHASSSGIDCLLSFDLLVGASDTNLVGADPERTIAVASTNAVPTGQMVAHPDIALPPSATMRDRVAEVTRGDENVFLDAAALAAGLLGSTTMANVLLLGAAVQVGAIPVPVEHIERAIELNGVAVEGNLAALSWGRAWVLDRDSVEIAADLPPRRRTRVDGRIDRPTRGPTSRATNPRGIRASGSARDRRDAQDSAEAARSPPAVRLHRGGRPSTFTS